MRPRAFERKRIALALVEWGRAMREACERTQGLAPHCHIQWIDALGEPTGDDNPAVALATCMFPDGSRSRAFCICAEHAKRAPHNWIISS